MSRSERAALALVEDAVRDGMSEREAAHWREAVADPCGCAEGMVGGLALGAVTAAAVLPAGPVGVLLLGGAGFAGGAILGKVVGVARGLRLARFQREQLAQRAAEVAVARPSVRRASRA